MSRYYDRNGEPIDMMTWARSFFENDDAKRVALTEHDGVSVSTVWLGLDHQYGDGPPLIFETMIFGGDHDEYQWRYSTEAEALVGHEAACRLAFGETEGSK